MIYLILLVLLVINLIFISGYCYLAAKIDRLKENSIIADDLQTSNADNITGKNKTHYLKEIYKYLDHYFYGWMYCNMLVTGKIPSNRIRKILYKYIFHMTLSKKTVISHGCEIRSPWNVKLGNCIIAANCLLDGRSGIEIQDNVVLGVNVHIWTQEHDMNDSYFAVNEKHKGSVIIKSRAWICSDSTILPSIIIGEGSVVASKACIVRNCDDFCVYGGVPAKKISERSRDLKYVLPGKPHWHFN